MRNLAVDIVGSAVVTPVAEATAAGVIGSMSCGDHRPVGAGDLLAQRLHRRAAEGTRIGVT